jgi:hypothetical protein
MFYSALVDSKIWARFAFFEFKIPVLVQQWGSRGAKTVLNEYQHCAPTCHFHFTLHSPPNECLDTATTKLEQMPGN